MGEDPTFVSPGGAPRKVEDPASLPRLDGKYVHKLQWRNVVLASVEPVAGQPDRFTAVMTPDWDHPLFFEHPLDHVPAMMMVEAGRQLGIAIGHLFYGVPLGVVYITETFDMAFTDFANTEVAEPVRIHAVASELRYRWVAPPLHPGAPPRTVFREQMNDPDFVRDALVNIRIDATFTQGKRDLGGMGGSCKLYARDQYIRLRQQHLAKAGSS